MNLVFNRYIEIKQAFIRVWDEAVVEQPYMEAPQFRPESRNRFAFKILRVFQDELSKVSYLVSEKSEFPDWTARMHIVLVPTLGSFFAVRFRNFIHVPLDYRCKTNFKGSIGLT